MPKKVLVVDDLPEVLALASAHLKASGYEVVEARDGAQALQAVEATRPDLIVMDLMLPAVDGWKVSHQLRTDDRFKTIPLILMSGLIDEEGQKGPLDECDFLLSKPFDPKLLVDKVHEFIGEP